MYAVYHRPEIGYKNRVQKELVIIFHNKTEYVNKMATYPKIQKLGAGAFGEVWKVERDPPNGVWIYAAMKIIKVVEELGITY